MNEQKQAGSRIASLWTAAALTGACFAASCSGGGGGSTPGGPKPRPVGQSTVLGLPVQVVERWVAYLADESTTTNTGTMMLEDYNGDLDSFDLVAHLANMATQGNVNVGVSADDFQLVRTVANGVHLFTVTDEAKDGKQWNLVAGDDVVLLHYNVSLNIGPTFVATLDTAGSTKLVNIDDRVYFTDVPLAPLANGETTLNYVDTAFPTTPMRISDDDASMPHTVQLLGQDEGLIFLYEDENPLTMIDLNGDGDFVDTTVLSLLDGTAPGATSKSVGLAMRDAMVPFRALNRGASDWLVAFLVNEAEQGATNLNALAIPEFGVAWQPIQCDTLDDMDTLDDVLHYLEFALWLVDPDPMTGTPPVNTGLVGSDRVLAVESNMEEFVGTISAEADEGTCDLNLDTMFDDDILRWVKVDTVVRPFGDSTELLSVERTNGGAEGVSDFGGRFLCVVDEADDGRDHDGDGNLDRTLIAWLDPADGNAATWDFDHCKDANPACAGIDSVGTQWVAERMERDRFLLAFQESVLGSSINDPFFRSKGGDLDTLDSVPTFGFFGGAPLELEFPGPRVAVDDDNAGVGIVNGRAFYRVDEAADSTDWNGDKDMLDFVLFRTDVATVGNSFYIGTLNTLLGPALGGGSEIGVAFVSDESMDLRDLNNDGDTDDFVLQWLRL